MTLFRSARGQKRSVPWLLRVTDGSRVLPEIGEAEKLTVLFSWLREFALKILTPRIEEPPEAWTRSGSAMRLPSLEKARPPRV
jgi:hypothetical protein